MPDFKVRPTVNGTNVLLAGEGGSVTSVTPLATDAFDETDPITDYPSGISIMPVSAAADWDGSGSDGTVTTDRSGAEGRQWLSVAGDDAVYWRVWDSDGVGWYNWYTVAAAGVSPFSIQPHPTDTWGEADPITSYPEGISIMPVSWTANWGPNNGEAGNVQTVRSNNGTYQIFTAANGGTMHFRTWSGSAWNSWTDFLSTSDLSPYGTDDWGEVDGANTYGNGLILFGVSSGANWGPNTGEAGTVVVAKSASGAFQTFAPHNSSSLYYRTWSGSAWNSWVDISRSTAPLATDAHAESAAITAYPDGISIMPVSSGANWSPLIGVSSRVITHRTGTEGAQEFFSDEGDYFWRYTSSGSWTAWNTWARDGHTHQNIVPLSTDAYAESAAITDYPNGISIMPVSSGANWGTSNGRAGHVLTERNGSTGKQTFVAPATGESETRYYTGGAWGSWASGGGGGWTAVDASTSTKGIAKASVAPASATEPIFVGDNDPRVPTTGENDALQGTSGTPSNTNRFVTDGDSRMTNARTPSAHTHLIADLPVADSGESNTTEVVRADDARLSNARTPTSHATSHEPGGSDAMAVDAAAGTGSLRTLGTGATQALPGNHASTTNARTPTSHASTHTNGTDDIQNATASQKGLATAAQITKLDGIEAGATADMTAAELRTAIAGGTIATNFLDLPEQGSPSSPAEDTLRLYAVDQNGFTVPEFRDSGGNTARINRDRWVIAQNTSGSAMSAGQVVQQVGVNGTTPTIGLADADSAATMPAFGILLDSPANNAYGRVLWSGVISGVNTTGMSAGAPLYVSGTAGGITTTAPSNPAYRQVIATVGSVGASGVIFVGVAAHFEQAPASAGGHITEVEKGSDQTFTGSTNYADITGLSFTVTSGVMYKYRIRILYTVAATTSAAKFAVNGPAQTYSAYTVKQMSSATADLTFNYNAYDHAGTVPTSSLYSTLGNFTQIDGMIQCSAGGTFIARLALDAAGSTVVVRAGSTLEYW